MRSFLHVKKCIRKSAATIAVLYYLLVLPLQVLALDPTYGWTKSWAGTATDYSFTSDVDSDSNRNVYVSGQFGDSNIDFDPGAGTDIHSSNGDQDGYLVKYDPTGVFVWARTWGGTGGDSAMAVSVDDTDYIYVTGVIRGTSGQTIDIDATSGTYNHVLTSSSALYTVKYDADGNFIWGKTINSSGNMWSLGLTPGPDDTMYVYGYFNSATQDFDPTETVENHNSGGTLKPFIQKFSTDGTYQWTRTFQGSGYARGDAITVDSDGNIYTAGLFLSTVDFDAGEGTANKTAASTGGDTFIAKYASDGTFVSVVQISPTISSGAITTYGLATDTGGNVYATGGFSETVDFDPGAGTANKTSAAGGDDNIYLLKLTSGGAFAWVKTFEGTTNSVGYSVTVDPNNIVYITGFFSGTVDFDGNAGTANKVSTSDWDTTMFAAAYDSDGNYSWARITDGGQETDGFAITATAYAVYIASDVYGTADFDPEGGGDLVTGETDSGSSSVTKWVTVPGEPSPTPTPTPTPSGTPTPTPTPSATATPVPGTPGPEYTPPPEPSPGSYPIITDADVTDTSVTLHFVPGAGPFTHYVVWYGRSPGSHEYGINPAGNLESREFTVSGLLSDTPYFFTLTPVNVLTEGTESPVFAARTTVVGSTEINIVTEPGESTPSAGSTVIATIVGPEDKPLPQIVIVLVPTGANSGENREYRSETNEEGRAEIGDVLAGTYDVTLTDKSGGSVKQTLIVPPGGGKLTVSYRLANSAVVGTAFNPNISEIRGLVARIPRTLGVSADTTVKVGVGTAAVGTFALFMATVIKVSQTLAGIFSLINRNKSGLPIEVMKASFQWLAAFAGIPFFRRGKGVTYDSGSRKPLSGVFVVFYSPSGNLRTSFTDTKGKYSVNLMPDKYDVRAEKDGYTFPSEVAGSLLLAAYANTYKPGRKITVDKENTFSSDVSIALDPLKKENKRIRLLKYVMFTFSIPLTLIAALYNPSIVNVLAIVLLALSGSKLMKSNSRGYT